jgi:hypothetical protein
MTLEPTARLRWVEHAMGPSFTGTPPRVLQQWWAPAVPAYMRNPIDGEWRDVETSVGEP